ncbi:MAG: GNAT family N-acetyltransferase [Desulfobacteraceae bacterium]|nr:GNAT family N-acetyltransferase [Desulfobacteraceae bacterium]
MEKQIDRSLEQHWREIKIQKQDIVLVAEEDSLIGFIAVWCRPTAFIENLHVRLLQRSKRVGSALMKAVAKELITKGHKTAYLWVFESNKKAILFYEKLGGRQKEQSMKNIFGYKVLSRKIAWDDLTLIYKNQ